jgi:hypothetical protein
MGGGGYPSLVLPFIYVPLPSIYLNACLQYNKQSKEEKNKKRYMKRRIRREQQEGKKEKKKDKPNKLRRWDHTSYVYIH